MMHAKSLVVDGVWSMFGSANFDNRSLELNDELNVAVTSRDLAARFLLDFEQDLQVAERIDARTMAQRSSTREERGRLLVTSGWRSARSVFLDSLNDLDDYNTDVRVRFAPSPTGYLHVGRRAHRPFQLALRPARTAARSCCASRTPTRERSSWEMVDGHRRRTALAGARLGRRAGRRRAACALLPVASASTAIARWPSGSSPRAAPTTATARRSRLQAKREAAEAAGGGWMYDRTVPQSVHGRNRRSAKRRARRAPSASWSRQGQTTFADLVHGPIAFDNANIEDFVILRSDGQPTYHLSVVADDVDMAISHVVRGDDHISNTPKQVLLYQAFGMPSRRSSRTCR